MIKNVKYLFMNSRMSLGKSNISVPKTLTLKIYSRYFLSFKV